MAGRYLTQFEPGEVIRHVSTRTVTEADNVGMTDVVFPNPVFHGDALCVETDVISARPSKSRPGQGIVEFAHRAFNQDDALVARCRRSALMMAAPQEAAIRCAHGAYCNEQENRDE